MDRNTAHGHKKIRLANLRSPSRDPAKLCQADGAQEKTRTSTTFRPQVPETCASTNFATWAGDTTPLSSFPARKICTLSQRTGQEKRLGGGGLYGHVASASIIFLTRWVFFEREQPTLASQYQDIGHQVVFRGSLLRPASCCANFPDRKLSLARSRKARNEWGPGTDISGVSVP